jgi:hypothetical protein
VQSPALDRLVNGEFKEAQCKESQLEDVEEETFIRFIEYAYTGKYGNSDDQPKTVVEAGPLSSKPVSRWETLVPSYPVSPADPPADKVPPAEDGWGFLNTSTGKKGKKKGKKGESSNTFSILATPQILANPAMFQPLGRTFDNGVSALKVSEGAPGARSSQSSRTLQFRFL